MVRVYVPFYLTKAFNFLKHQTFVERENENRRGEGEMNNIWVVTLHCGCSFTFYDEIGFILFWLQTRCIENIFYLNKKSSDATGLSWDKTVLDIVTLYN